MTTVASELEHMELQQQYSSMDTVNNRWDDDWDNENSSARLFERSRIKALAGRSHAHAPPLPRARARSPLFDTAELWVMTAAPSGCDVTSCHCREDGSGSQSRSPVIGCQLV